MQGKNKTLKLLIGAVVGMFFFSFALVPLYNVFCEVTGLNGKVFQASESEVSIEGESRPLALQFISSNNENMPWVFNPSEKSMKIETGKYYTTTFYVKNATNKTMTSQAVPSVAPSNAADYLKKLECFCFEQQVLEPGEEAYLPVRLLVSNDLPDSINSIVMSYTIFDITDYNNEDLAHHNMGME